MEGSDNSRSYENDDKLQATEGGLAFNELGDKNQRLAGGPHVAVEEL